MPTLRSTGHSSWSTSPILAAGAAFLFLPNVVAVDITRRVGTERWEVDGFIEGNASLVLGFACRTGLPAKISDDMPEDYCNGINGTCIRGVCLCRRGYYQASSDSCKPVKSGILQMLLSVLSWLPILYLLIVLVAAMYDAFVHGVFTIMERDTDGAVLEASSKPMSPAAPNEPSVTECGTRHRRHRGAVRVEKIAEGVEYDWAYDSALDQGEDDVDM